MAALSPARGQGALSARRTLRARLHPKPQAPATTTCACSPPARSAPEPTSACSSIVGGLRRLRLSTDPASIWRGRSPHSVGLFCGCRSWALPVAGPSRMARSARSDLAPLGNAKRWVYSARRARIVLEVGCSSRQLLSSKLLISLVPQEGFEPPTHALRMRCSTPELLRLFSISQR